MRLQLREKLVRLAILCACGAAILGFACIASAVSRVRDGVILDNVTIAGVRVGGLEPGAALLRLRPVIQKALNQRARLTGGESTLGARLTELGISADPTAAIEAALALGSEDDLMATIRSRVEVLRLGRDIPMPLRADPTKLRAWLSDAAGKIDRAPQDARIRLRDGEAVVEPEALGRKLNVEASLEHLAASLSASGGLGEAFRAELVVEAVPPRVSAADLQGFEVLGEFSTRFKPYQSNRNHNIELGAQALDNTVVPAGEVFSLNRTTGRRTWQKGYRTAPIYSGRKVVMGIGGGMCQVSTTVYNAARRAGMTIVERHPHSLPVFYVPSGMDATVAWDAADLKFRNDTAGPVVVKAWVEGNTLTVAVLGRKTGGSRQ